MIWLSAFQISFSGIPLKLNKPLHFPLAVFPDQLQQIPALRQIHHDTQTTGFRIIKSVLVADYVRVLDGGQDPDLVQGILLLFLGELEKFYFLEGVELVVGFPAHFWVNGPGKGGTFVDAAEGTFPDLFHDFVLAYVTLQNFHSVFYKIIYFELALKVIKPKIFTLIIF